LLQFDIELDVILELVILWIWALFNVRVLAFLASLIVPKVASTQDARLLEHPVEKFLTKSII